MGPPPRADAIHQHRPHLQQNDATLVITVEVEAENEAANGDLRCGSVEEEVLLAVGEDRKGREEPDAMGLGRGIFATTIQLTEESSSASGGDGGGDGGVAGFRH
ncbi:hypothetical protein GYH30_040271 [Glycine max]|nr:hypothetical protein GYH30_040271 [Glycine max]